MIDAQWLVVGASVQGAAHVRSGKPGQDAIFWTGPADGYPSVVLAVADGHGSGKAFRSASGANFAVRCAAQQVRGFVEGQIDSASLSAIKRMATEGLPQEIVKEWTSAVEQDLAANPLTVLELQALPDKDRDAVERNPLLAYGSTVLTVAVTEHFVLYLQLGDGDIVHVSEEGEPTRPLPKDDRLFANETTSLCAPGAWKDFRVQFQVISERRPALIMLATDGYINSYQSEEGFLKVGTDILKVIREEGPEKVNQELPGWLTETSEKGSGDDITLGLIVRQDLSHQQSSFFSKMKDRIIGK